MGQVLQGVTVFVIFLGMSSPVLIIGLVYYYMKRLEHKQIMAAIEKGTPLSELKPPKQKQNGALWIRNLTFGIAMIIVGLAFLVAGPGGDTIALFIALILCGVGLAWLIRGLLYRKYQPQSQPSDESNAAEEERKVSA
jgi:hypothetical protein